MPFGGSKAGTFEAPPEESRPQKIDQAVLPGIEDRDRFIEKKRDDLVWRALWRADAALKVEEYFRTPPRHPSYDDMMKKIDLAPNAVDKDFLGACKVVAKNFREQKEAVASVMSFLLEQNTKAQIPNTEEALGKVLYEDMMKGRLAFYSKTGMKLRQMNGFLLLTIDNEAAYNALYNELTPENRSGGRFHRAQEITIAKRKIPVIVCRGEREGPIEKDPLMIHEIQHWINEGLLGLGFMEKSEQAVFELPQEERELVLDELSAQRRIKDEVLAYLREGRGAEVERILTGKLYKDLFAGADEPVQKRRKSLGQIQKSLNAFAPLMLKYPRLKDILTYMLLPISLGHIATRLDTIRTTFERADGVGQMVLPVILRDIPQFLPRVFANIPAEMQSATEDAQAIQQHAAQFMQSSPPSNKKHIEYAQIRNGMKNAQYRGEKAWERLQKGFHGSFVPYVSQIEGVEDFGYYECNVEEDSVRDILDYVQNIPKNSIDILHAAHTEYYSESRDIAQDIAREIILNIVGSISGKLYAKPNVEIQVRRTGVEIHIMRIMNTSYGERCVRYTVSIPRSEDGKNSEATGIVPKITSEYPTTYYERTFQERQTPGAHGSYTMVPQGSEYEKIYRLLFEKTKDIIHLRDSALGLQQYAQHSSYDLKQFRDVAQGYDNAREDYQHLQEKLFRSNAHIPLISRPYFPAFASGNIENEDFIKEPIEKFRENLFTTFNTIDQDIVDAWIDPPEPFEEDWSREAAILDIIQKKIGTQYKGGKIQNIGLDEVDFTNSGRCTILVSFSVKDSLGKWQSGIINVQLFARRKVRRQVAKTADSR